MRPTAWNFRYVTPVWASPRCGESYFPYAVADYDTVDGWRVLALSYDSTDGWLDEWDDGDNEACLSTSDVCLVAGSRPARHAIMDLTPNARFALHVPSVEVNGEANRFVALTAEVVSPIRLGPPSSVSYPSPGHGETPSPRVDIVPADAALATGLVPWDPRAASLNSAPLSGTPLIYPSVGLWVAIVVTVAFGAIPAWVLYRRVTSATALERESRLRILNDIQANPGTTAFAVSTRLAVDPSTVAHHVRVLEEFGHLVLHRSGGRTVLFPNHGAFTRRDRVVVALLRNPMRRALVDAVRAAPGIRQADLARLLRVTPAGVKKHLDVLAAEGILCVETAGREKRVRLDAMTDVVLASGRSSGPAGG